MATQDPCQALRELLNTMHRLRSPGGCAWDAEQTPTSLLPYLLEEACEVIEAIEEGDPQAIVDELGDLLLQIVFQAEIFAERGLFDFAAVATAINRKLLRRHPHVFAATPADRQHSTEELAQQWESLKQLERAAHPASDQHPLGVLPGRLPALQRAQKMVARARRKGISLGRQPLSIPSEPQSEEALGEHLLSLVQQAETLGLDAESALRRTIRRRLQETRTAALSTTNAADAFQQKSNEKNSARRLEE